MTFKSYQESDRSAGIPAGAFGSARAADISADSLSSHSLSLSPANAPNYHPSGSLPEQLLGRPCPEYWSRFSQRFPELKIRSRGYVPHFEILEGIYFITFHLADCLPQALLDQYLSEREKILEAAKRQKREPTASDKAELDWLFSERMDRYLDSGSGECLLANSEIADTVASAFHHFDGKRYRLFAWCVMPNHVHLVMQTLAGDGLEKILHSWKSFTSSAANKLLHRKGSFWQREYYDHLIRDGGEFDRIVDYVLRNPEKAGLRNWSWVWSASGWFGEGVSAR